MKENLLEGSGTTKAEAYHEPETAETLVSPSTVKQVSLHHGLRKAEQKNNSLVQNPHLELQPRFAAEPTVKAWRWQHQDVGMLFFSREQRSVGRWVEFKTRQSYKKPSCYI
ncbi:hypothetical protein ATANTOWER_016659 [Ataeniobius toweri]|uniref:Uncharacterized protein n=1 Tax=Ataeniobius toweri TaxID=208326 RepID=A0ABU7AFT3_9TELE|nr:hypothetical protein [Ataeniobius toweri]